ncbi:orotidine-5'-phosphate decarboxylase [Muricoccus pecuniae]|uniref:Orotidine 5'-phosphate decarboxylase n=1 Tax=Muricoccus pecuniae TaxID=693023 RepID=A0A840YDS8_9PROT|nr:orotidine-5'-phosphate decarboxylase [Roseomonas pecuniae]MBB5694301.1 orotidine-5'-phosphate decarboxylase [Roseomonas pecuniae]
MIPRPGRAGIIAALDTGAVERAEAWAAALAPHVGCLKLGLEFFVAHGPAAVARIARHAPLFLDLKFHDIPNTVAGAVRSACALRPAMLTVHASGGAPMIEAARRAAEAEGGAGRPAILAVTVLTSTDAATLAATGVPADPAAQVLHLARLALDAGADGLVCAPPEVAPLRAAHGPGPLLVVPGVRPAGSARDDQSRVATPAEAAAAGASWLVIGRPITTAPDPAAAAAAIAAEIAA